MEDLSPAMSNLMDDLLIHIMQYLKFDELIHSVWILSKRLHKLRNNSHSLYSLKNYPLYCRHSSNLMEKYCDSLIKTDKTDTFIYRDIKKLEWMNLFDELDDRFDRYRYTEEEIIRALQPRESDALTTTMVLFQNLHSLHYLSIWGLSTTIIKYLPTQNNLQSLCIRAQNCTVDPPIKLLTFLRNKICVYSFCLLKQLHIERFVISTDLLNLLSKMVHLEVFKFNEIYFDRKEYEDDGIITQTLLKDTFSCWMDIHTLDIFDIPMENGRSTFGDGDPYDWMLQILLSFKTLRSLKLGISPFDDQFEPYNQYSAINRILPYFEHIEGLQELHLSVTATNMLFNQEIVKAIGYQRFNRMSIDFPCMDEHFGDLDGTSFILECIAMTTDVFHTSLPHDERKRLTPFRRFVKGIYERRKSIRIQELKMELVCFADLVEIMHQFAGIASFLAKVCLEIGCRVEIQWIHGDEIYTSQEWNEIMYSLACAGFLVNRNHPGLTSDCLFLYCDPQHECFWILVFVCFVLSWKR
eukprot:54630_1